jgi:hypothetical protein
MQFHGCSLVVATRISPQRNGGLGALPRPSPVICGYWTKAIALPRVPWHLPFRFVPCHNRSHAIPAKAGSPATNLVARYGKSPSRASWPEVLPKQSCHGAHAKASSPGQPWGLGRDALGLSHLTYQTTRRIFLHQLDQPPFPCKHKLPPMPPSVKSGYLSGYLRGPIQSTRSSAKPTRDSGYRSPHRSPLRSCSRR